MPALCELVSSTWQECHAIFLLFDFLRYSDDHNGNSLSSSGIGSAMGFDSATVSMGFASGDSVTIGVCFVSAVGSVVVGSAVFGTSACVTDPGCSGAGADS